MKLSAEFVTTWPDELLREFARDVLAARRFNTGYLVALRHVLGNQARADEAGAVLDQNTRVDFATERTMTTINHKLHAAGIVERQPRVMGAGRPTMVYAYRGKRPDAVKRLDPVADLVAPVRKQEERDDAGRALSLSLLTLQGQRAAHAFNGRQAALSITDADVPY